MTALDCLAFVTRRLCHGKRMQLKRRKICSHHQPALIHTGPCKFLHFEIVLFVSAQWAHPGIV